MKIFLLVIGIIVFQDSKSCSCVYPGKIDEKQFNQYDLILSGVVISDRVVEHRRIIQLRVDEYYKGEQSDKTVQINTAEDEGMCGLSVKVGERWLVYAYEAGSKFESNLCTRTKSMNPKAWDYREESLNEDLAFLKKKRRAEISN